MNVISALQFKDKANTTYCSEIDKLIVEQSGQMKLVFIPLNIFEAFQVMYQVTENIQEELKRAVVRGLGAAIETVICHQAGHYCHGFIKDSSQVFNGQLTSKKAKFNLWVEVIVFYTYHGNKKQLTYKHNFSSKDNYSDEAISKLITKVDKNIQQQLKDNDAVSRLAR